MTEKVVSEKYKIRVQVLSAGEDLCVLLTGGDAPHIGAVSAGCFGPGVGAAHMTEEEKNRLHEGVRTYAFPAHRDDAMSAPLAENLSERLQRNVVVLCGIHIDDLPKEEIEEIVNLLPAIEEEIVKISLDT